LLATKLISLHENETGLDKNNSGTPYLCWRTVNDHAALYLSE